VLDEAEIWRRVRDVFASFFGDSTVNVNAGTTAADVPGWDSLANVELMVEVEQAFGIRFRTGEVAGLRNVGELVALIVRRLAG
jgi:acyl carrier protein